MAPRRSSAVVWCTAAVFDRKQRKIDSALCWDPYIYKNREKGGRQHGTRVTNPQNPVRWCSEHYFCVCSFWTPAQNTLFRVDGRPTILDKRLAVPLSLRIIFLQWEGFETKSKESHQALVQAPVHGEISPLVRVSTSPCSSTRFVKWYCDLKSFVSELCSLVTTEVHSTGIK